MNPAEKPRVEIGAFRGGFPELAAMMQDAWAANREQPLLYTAEFLANLFEYPGASLELAPAVYAGGRVAAFVAGFPRSVVLGGRPARLLANSFLTASRQYKAPGYWLGVYRELIDRARAAGFDGLIGYGVEGDGMNRVMPQLAKLFDLDTQLVYSVNYLSRFLRPVPPAPPAQATGDDIAAFLELAAALPQTLPLRRTWTREEAEWQCRGRSGAVAATIRKDGGRGMITGYVMSVDGTPPARVVLIEDLLWGTLDAAGQSELLQRFLRAAAAAGAQSASCPVLGYASTEPLAAAGFRPSKRVLHAYLTLWNGRQPAPLDALYMDVF